MKTAIGAVLGLDPAGPLFENRDWGCGLNPSCADLVDVLHTNGVPGIVMNLGTMKQLGHVDFYPNGGGEQPECILDPFQRGGGETASDALGECPGLAFGMGFVSG